MKIRTRLAKLFYNRRHRLLPRVHTEDPASRASNGQDIYVAEHLPNADGNRVFIEIGGNDGITLSNTCYLEKEAGWKGISVEPLPRAYRELEKNRSCITVQGAITEYDGHTAFYAITGGPEMLSGIPEKYDPRHKRRVRKNLKRQRATAEEITVPCFRLDSLLKQHAIDHVDYLSIDTEGGELDILRSIDLDAIQVEILSVENNYFNDEVECYLVGQGYRLVAIAGLDEIYRRQE